MGPVSEMYQASAYYAQPADVVKASSHHAIEPAGDQHTFARTERYAMGLLSVGIQWTANTSELYDQLSCMIRFG